MGTLAAIPLYLLVSGLPTSWFIALLVVGFVAGIRICQSATDAIGMPDHGAIVWDEVIGFGVTMIAAPAGWEWVLAGFVLFRLFDVLKPWPISWFDRRIHGGLGIMLDDLIAGLFAWPACNCLPTGEGRRLPNARLVVFHSSPSCKEVGYTHAGPEGPAFLYAIPPGLPCRRPVAQVDPSALSLFSSAYFSLLRICCRQKIISHKYSLLIRSWPA